MTRLFVYGTLLPGEEAWTVLEPWVVGEPVVAFAWCAPLAGLRRLPNGRWPS
ncbi:MAG TPA: hypothetical protein VFR41_08655 [Acidimicrobiia bacterium]|nr:hypothetical protein [Acidimicrobiia bacterium]